MSTEMANALPPKLSELVLACYLRLQSPAMAERLWQRHLTEEQRQKLGGDLQSAWQQGGVIGMWRRLYDVDENRALVEVARLIGGLGTADYEWACRELGMSSNNASAACMTRPSWNRDALELSFEGEVVRRIERPDRAVNLIRLLNAFEEDGWPSRIDDPLPFTTDTQRIHKMVNSLNRGLTRISFHADGTCEGIRWQRKSMGR